MDIEARLHIMAIRGALEAEENDMDRQVPVGHRKVCECMVLTVNLRRERASSCHHGFTMCNNLDDERFYYCHLQCSYMKDVSWQVWCTVQNWHVILSTGVKTQRSFILVLGLLSPLHHLLGVVYLSRSWPKKNQKSRMNITS